ncbi:MAG: dipeptidase PepE [Bacteroidales bacterium]|nr:dipeptidase PepE [Bacteroidales bacterium]
MRNLLLISNSTNPGEAYLGWCKELIVEWCKENNVKTALFIPYAGVTVTWDDLTERVKTVFSEFGVEISSIHQQSNAVEAVKNAECIVVSGGSTWNLLAECYNQNIVDVIREKALSGMPYMGWSAGSNLACPTIKTTNDMPIIEPKSFNATNLIPFQINPHYLDAHPAGHGGETREDRIKEFMVINPNVYVAGLREATALVVKGDTIKLVGREKNLRVFKFGQETKEYAIGSDIGFLLK